MTRPKFLTIESTSDTAQILQQFSLAKVKHPIFAERFTDSAKEQSKLCLERLRQKNDNPMRQHDCMSIILEELFETEEAFLDGDFEQALKELAHTGATVLRAMKWIRSQQENKRM